MTNLTFIDLGLADFRKVWRFQKDLVAHRKYHGGNDILIFCEHKPVVTLGRRTKKENILLDSTNIKKMGIDVVKIDRGGDVTFHVPGQLVAYPIFDLKKKNRDIGLFLEKLEKVVINTLLFYNIKAHTKGKIRGVWVEDKKVCSLGIGISGWISYHGLAVNINNDLSYFSFIKPCGLNIDEMTSLVKILGKKKDINEFKKILLNKFIKTFNYHF
jgi:lipoate-protein ligase B